MSLSRAAIEGVLISHGMSYDEINRALAPSPQIIRTAQDLDRSGCLVPDPQIIRTPADLEALDPDSIVLDCTGHLMTRRDRLPAVVVATGEHVRACREALEEETP